jgi:hypothetical protein
MPVCEACGKIVKDLRRHRTRGRCSAKGRKKEPLLARYVTGTAENRLALDSGGFANMGDDNVADFTPAHKHRGAKQP